jgi:multisite-specific tRNA:(cytosine-C5)-methyltransferase
MHSTHTPTHDVSFPCRERKRDLDIAEGEDAAALPDPKRARIATEGGAEAEAEAEDASAMDVEPDPTAEPTTPGSDADADTTAPLDAAEDGGPDDDAVQQPSGPTMMLGKKLMKGEGGFKENPYTFLSPDDPILVSCL